MTNVYENIDLAKRRHKNYIKQPSQEAGDKAHIVVNIGADGAINNYTVFKPNPKNPSGFDEYIRVDLVGGSHRDKEGIKIQTPHVHLDSKRGIRKAYDEEIPIYKGKKQ